MKLHRFAVKVQICSFFGYNSFRSGNWVFCEIVSISWRSKVLPCWPLITKLYLSDISLGRYNTLWLETWNITRKIISRYHKDFSLMSQRYHSVIIDELVVLVCYSHMKCVAIVCTVNFISVLDDTRASSPRVFQVGYMAEKAQFFWKWRLFEGP